MSERKPLYERTIVSKVILEREQEVKRAARVLAVDYGIFIEDWFQVRDELVKRGVPQFLADQSIIDMGKKKADKPDMRQTYIMTPVSADQVENGVKEETPTQEARVARPKIIQFSRPSKSGLRDRLERTTVQASVAKK